LVRELESAPDVDEDEEDEENREEEKVGGAGGEEEYGRWYSVVSACMRISTLGSSALSRTALVCESCR
jgi:hypothetical protein